MPAPPPTATFGAHLRLLRRQSRLTQAELGIAVGYSPGQISMLESGQRLPDATVVAALFVTALGLAASDPQAQMLIGLAQHTHPARTEHKSHLNPRITHTVERRVMWERQELGVLEDIPPLPTHLAPRQTELTRLRHMLHHERRAALVGLPGMGKTTLAACLAHQHAQAHPVFWMTISRGLNQTHDDVLRQLALFVIAHSHDLTFANAFVNDPTQTPTQTPSPPTIPIAHLLDGLCANLCEFDAPLLVFDDAHYLQNDPALHTALNRLHALVPNASILFTSRQMLDANPLPHLLLSGLAEAEARTWLAQLNAGLNPWQVEQLLSRTQHNPLLLRLAAHADPATRSSPINDPINPIVETVLHALSPSAQHALAFLSIVQTEVNLFDPNLARLLQAQHPAYVHVDAVRDLQRHTLIEQPAYATAHALVREPVRNALRLRPVDWAASHRTAAQWAAHKDDEVTAAHHWQQAGELVRACDAMAAHTKTLPVLSRVMQAVRVLDDLIDEAQHTPNPQAPLLCRLHTLRGEWLVNTLRATEARASFTEALSLANKPVQRARIAERLAHYLQNTGQFAEALTLCDDALALLGKSILPEAIQIRLQLNTPRIKALIGLARFEEARAVCQDLLNTANKMALLLPKPAQQIRAQTQLALGYIARITWRSDAATQHLHEAARHAQHAGLADVEANALILLSATLRDLGQFVQADASAAQALTVAEASGNSVMVATVLHWASVLSYFRDEQEAALQQSGRALAVRHKLGDTEGVLACHLLQAIALLALNLQSEARALAAQIIAAMPALQNPWLRGYADYICGIVALCDVAYADACANAHAHFAHALGIEAFCADPDISASARLFVAWAHLAQGDVARCDEVLARTVLPPGHIQPHLLHNLTQAMAALVKGQPDEALALAQALAQRARETGYFVYAHEAARLIRAISLAAMSPISNQALPRYVICDDRVLMPYRQVK